MVESTSGSANSSTKEELVRICEELMARKAAHEKAFEGTRLTTFKSLEVHSASKATDLSRVFDSNRAEAARLKLTLEAYKLMGIEVKEQSSESIHVKFSVSCDGTDKHVHAVELNGGKDNCEIGKYFLPPEIRGDDVPENDRSAPKVFEAIRWQCFVYYDRSQQLRELQDFLASRGFEGCIFATHDKKYVEIVVPFKLLKLSPSKIRATFILKYRNGDRFPHSIQVTSSDEERGSALNKALYNKILATNTLVKAFEDMVT